MDSHEVNARSEGRAPATRFEHLRGLLRRMDSTVDSTRDRRLGRVMVEPSPVPAALPFPKASAASDAGKPRAVAKSLSDFEAAFARLTERQAG